MSEQSAVTALKAAVAQKREADEQIANLTAAAKAELKESLQAQATAAGYDIYDLFGVKKPRKVRKASAPWTNPNDPSQVWPGQGKRPKWLIELLAAGYTQEQLQKTN